MLPNGDYPFPFSFYNYSLMSFERKGFLSSSFVFLSLDSQIPILIKGYNLTFFLFLYSNCPILVRDTIQDGSWFFVFLWGFFCILSFFGISLSSEQDVSVHPAPWKMVFRNQDLGREASLIVFFKSSIAPYNICFS